MKADQVQQQLNTNLLKEKNREGITNLHTNFGQLGISSRKNLEAFDSHCQQQFTQLCELMRKEIQEEFSTRDRKIRALEDFCTTASFAQTANQVPNQNDQDLMPSSQPERPVPNAKLPTRTTRTMLPRKWQDLHRNSESQEISN